MSKITTWGLGSAATRNLKFVLVPALLACTSLTGCGTIMEALTQGKADGMVNAMPINFTSGPLAAMPDVHAERLVKLDYLGKVVSDSEDKCGAFVSGLVLGENTINTTADVSATVFSVLSTAFTPPGTKTALSAASSIASGSKTAVDADIYDKAATSDFSTAIEKTYSAKIQDYTTNLPTLQDSTDTPLIVSNEVAKIKAIHGLCGLAQAESSIHAQLSGTTQPKPPPPSPPDGSDATKPPAKGKHVANIASRPATPVPTEQPKKSATQAPIWGNPW